MKQISSVAKTQALDLVTILHALMTLETECLGADRVWTPAHVHQARLLALYAGGKSQIASLHSLKSKAGTDFGALNEFLTSNGFPPMFGQGEGIGVVSILDMLIEWIQKGTPCEISVEGAYVPPYPGFEIKQGFEAFRVAQNEEPLIRLLTKSGDSLWAVIPNKLPENPIDMAFAIFDLMHQTRSADYKYTSVQMPLIDIDVKPDLSFLLNASTIDESGIGWYVAQAMQQFKLRINAEGARAKVATAIEMRSLSFKPNQAYVFDRPFLTWMTQGNSELPLAMAQAGTDSWKDGGDLGSL